MRLGDTLDAATQPTQTVGFQSILDSILKAGTVYLSIQQQSDLQRINLQRAQQGLAPLDPAQYAAGVNVGLSSSTQNALLWIAGGIGALLLVSMLMKGRR